MGKRQSLEHTPTGQVIVGLCDAGGANLLLPVLQRLGERVEIFAQGPAGDILRESGLNVQIVESTAWHQLPELGLNLLADKQPAVVFCGTSWGPSVDKALLWAARNRNIPSVAAVDHWELFRERFSRVENARITKADMFLPDQVWVADSSAHSIAIAAGLPAERVVALGHPHLESQARRLRAVPRPGRSEAIVFVSERLREDRLAGSPLDRGRDEYAALELVLAAARQLRRPVTVKLHPQEPPDKYTSILLQQEHAVTYVGKCDLAQLIHSAGHLVGLGSMLLLEAALVRNDVISLLPRPYCNDFIGMKLGVVQQAEDLASLCALLSAPPASTATESFGDRFIGSTDAFAARLEEMTACV